MKKRVLFFLSLLLLSFLSVLPIPKVHAVSPTITYNAGTNTISATGGDLGTEISFWDFWNASNVNGWDIAQNNNGSNTQFEFDAKIVIGDGFTETWFANENVQVTFSEEAITANGQTLIYVSEGFGAGVHFRLGKLSDATYKTTENGVSIISLETTSAFSMFYSLDASDIDVQLYDSQFSASKTFTIFRTQGVVKIYGCSFNMIRFQMLASTYSSLDMYRTDIKKSLLGIQITDEDVIFEDVSVHSNSYGTAISGAYGGYFKNTQFRNNTLYDFYLASLSGTVYLVDVEADWSFLWAGTCTEAVYRQYTFKINVTDIEGSPIENATVTLVDLDGVEEFSVVTGSNGSFAVQNVNYGFYNQTGGNTPYMKTPHNLTITHSSYDTLSYKVTINEWKTVVQVVLGAPRGSFTGGFGLGFILMGLVGLVFAVALAVGYKKH